MARTGSAVSLCRVCIELGEGGCEHTSATRFDLVISSSNPVLNNKKGWFTYISG